MNIQVPSDIWIQICLSLPVKALHMLRSTCKELRATVDNRTVWHSTLVDLMKIKDTVYSREDVENMSAAQLREASVRIVQIDHAFRSWKLPHHKVSMPLEVKCSDMVLLPGGDRLLVVGRDGSFTLYQVATGQEILLCPYSADPSWSTPTRTSVFGLHPISLHDGYIALLAIVWKKVPNHDNGYMLVRELRVYKYTSHDIVPVFTETVPGPEDKPCLNLSHAQLGAISVTRLYSPDDPSNFRVIGVKTTTVDHRRHDDTQTTCFRIANSVLYSWSSLEILSPEYILNLPLHRPGPISLFDITQAKKATEPSPVLQPFWTQGYYSRLSLLRTETSRRDPRFPATHIALLATEEELFILAIRRISGLGATPHVHLVRFPLPASPVDSILHFRMDGDFSHGLIWMQLHPEPSQLRCDRTGTGINTKTARKGLWSYTVDWPTEGESPGYMRLDRPSAAHAGPPALPDVLFENTCRAFTDEGIEAQSMTFRVDTVSGKFVQFPKRDWSNIDFEELDTQTEAAMYLFGDGA